jgi:hypothetical protein
MSLACNFDQNIKQLQARSKSCRLETVRSLKKTMMSKVMKSMSGEVRVVSVEMVTTYEHMPSVIGDVSVTVVADGQVTSRLASASPLGSFQNT